MNEPVGLAGEAAASSLRSVVAGNMRRIRLARGLSLRELSESTGVSKALLSQIERGVANPTIEVLSRVARALGESFLELARPRLMEPQVLRAVAGGDDAGVRILFASGERLRFEVSEGVIPAGTRSPRSSHGMGSVEHAYIVSGAVSVSSLDWTVELGAGDSVRFAGEHDHVYVTGAEPVRVLTLLSFDEI
ncbi:XRE family transcriptional regulator [Actinocorallia longicatena]|uniref:XRE family transcriptional regulator n=1 Tax=Actinocorallia longicatena TaxID=111803 RepID=A0ABP6QBI4_9ACTN